MESLPLHNGQPIGGHIDLCQKGFEGLKYLTAEELRVPAHLDANNYTRYAMEKSTYRIIEETLMGMI